MEEEISSEVSIVKKNLGYFKNIYNYSIELQKRYEKDDFEGIGELLKARWEIIERMNEKEHNASVKKIRNFESNGRIFDHTVKSLLSELNCTLKNIKNEDEKLNSRLMEKKENVEEEIASLAKGKKMMEGYSQVGDVHYNLDILQ